jgi:hypothetical protein
MLARLGYARGVERVRLSDITHLPQPASTMAAVNPFAEAHRSYIKSLYRRMLKNEQDWVIRYDLVRPRALAIRAQFEANR